MSGDRPITGQAAEAARKPRSRSATKSPKRPPPFGFFKGAALGFIIVIPAVAWTVWVLARLGLGDPALTMARSIRMTTLFAGLPAVLTAGGIGRLAAEASTMPRGRRESVLRASRVQAVAGAGLALIAAIPHGHLPASPVHWIWIGLAGAATGAGAGVLIGLICGAPRWEGTGVPELLRRVPVVADWARAASRDPRVATATAAGRRALVTETARQATPPPTRPGARPRARRVESAPVDPEVERTSKPIDTVAPTAPRPGSTDGGATPLPHPVPLGDEVTTGVEAEPVPPATVKPEDPKE